LMKHVYLMGLVMIGIRLRTLMIEGSLMVYVHLVGGMRRMCGMRLMNGGDLMIRRYVMVLGSLMIGYGVVRRLLVWEGLVRLIVLVG
jgi:hypothetical protein